ncbi:MAG TPA: hypothetical protein VGG72_28055, partial [Bryobacteraceae bacterium]
GACASSFVEGIRPIHEYDDLAVIVDDGCKLGREGGILARPSEEKEQAPGDKENGRQTNRRLQFHLNHQRNIFA